MTYVPRLFVGGPYHGTWAAVDEDALTIRRPVIPRLTAFRRGDDLREVWVVSNKPLPPYPEFPCSKAPLPPGSAPKDGCKCKVCEALRANAKVKRG